MNKLIVAGGVVLVILGVIASSSLFIVEQTQQAIVLFFGKPQKTIQDPGLYFKIPFGEEVVYYDKRVLDLDPPKERMILADQKRLDVDSYARYRIIDPLLFYQTTRRVSEVPGKLSPIINSSLRRVLGNETLLEILSGKRATIMVDIQKAVNDAVMRFGMEIVEVRVRRADYPDETRSNIENRMKSEREREAKEFRARGFEMAEGIRADAGKQKIVILAEAQKKAETLRGEGDGLAIKIYADAFGQDPEFFAFYRSMQAYKKSMDSQDTTMVLSPNSDFFRFFGDMSGRDMRKK
ncbi:MAG: HflC protein [Candidatus Endolissoclinum sp. TMED55]|jgi:membrane protease subunit HflC|nr:MAG: HflC protein [Candidatus Endolissoclinum sp. TMED55]|tara:strand:- start:2874 stop:3755 length:882 start_codon:yes stop_codon:yes gene_type:complete